MHLLLNAFTLNIFQFTRSHLFQVHIAHYIIYICIKNVILKRQFFQNF